MKLQTQSPSTKRKRRQQMRRNPVLEFLEKVRKLPPAKYHYPNRTDDELLYDDMFR